MKIVNGIFILIISLMLFLTANSYAEGLVDDGNDSTCVKLNSGLVTEVEFPANIANVTKSVPSQLLQIETSGNRMFLLARENFNSSIYVITADNLSYCLRLASGEDKVSSSHVTVKRQHGNIREQENRNGANTVRLLKALINGECLKDLVDSKAKGKEVYNNGSIRIVTDEVYEFSQGVKAVVLTIENLTSRSIVIPIEHIEFPGLLAISVENQLLEAHAKDTTKRPSCYTTKAYMIIEG